MIDCTSERYWPIVYTLVKFLKRKQSGLVDDERLGLCVVATSAAGGKICGTRPLQQPGRKGAFKTLKANLLRIYVLHPIFLHPAECLHNLFEILSRRHFGAGHWKYFFLLHLVCYSAALGVRMFLFLALCVDQLSDDVEDFVQRPCSGENSWVAREMFSHSIDLGI